jgi:hypothetical protein
MLKDVIIKHPYKQFAIFAKVFQNIVCKCFLLLHCKSNKNQTHNKTISKKVPTKLRFFTFCIKKIVKTIKHQSKWKQNLPKQSKQ